MLLALMGTTVRCQDIHFSNYSAVPVFLNPATTGMFEGDIRFITAYKNQWSGFSNSFKTFYSSFDANLSDPSSNKIIGTGLSFYNDKAGASQMGISQFNLSVACNLKVNDNNFFGAGLKAGIAQIGYNTNVIWDSQYSNGVVDPASSSGEMNLNTNTNYFDMGGGLLWTFANDNNLKATTGLSWSKSGSAFFDGNISNPNKFAAHSTAEIPVGSTPTSVLPYISYIQYSTSSEMNIGSIFKYDLGLNSKYTGRNTSSAVYLGAIYRYGDAIVAVSRLDYKRMLSIGFCYDITISSLSNATQRNGGPEISLSYIGNFKGKGKTGKAFL